jgi:hypothetical protein
MQTMITGGFEEIARAELAMTALEATGFQHDQIVTFFGASTRKHRLEPME